MKTHSHEVKQMYRLHDRLNSAVANMKPDKACAIRCRWHAWRAIRQNKTFRKFVTIFAE